MKLLLIGAGVRTPLLLPGLIRRQDALGLTEVALYDSDPERLATMGHFARFVAERWGARFAVSHTDDLRIAARGTDFVFSSIRVGQERHRILDERIALEHGVLGQETTGPGGFAMALRTIPVLLEYARVLGEVAPDAWVINFTNPAGLITQALRQETDLKVIGICDTPTAMLTSLARFLDRPADDLYLEYFGLNHLGWVRRVLVAGRDVLPEILGRYEELSAAGGEWGLFDPTFVRLWGLLPNEYLYYYYYREQAVANILASGSTRGEQILGLNEPLWRELHAHMASDRPEDALAAYERTMLARHGSYMARESGRATGEPNESSDSIFVDEGYAGLALAAMQAIVQRTKTVLTLNVPNRGALDILGPEDVVEVPCLVDEHGPTPLAQAPVPGHVRPLIEAVKTYERLAVDAAVTGSYAAAVQALTVHPLVASYSLSRQLLDDYLEAHREYLPQFARATLPA